MPTISGSDGTRFGFEGDGVQFGIDANRPVYLTDPADPTTAVITAVFIDANVSGAKKSQIFNPGWSTGLIAPGEGADGYDAERPAAVFNFADLIYSVGDALLSTAENGRLEKPNPNAHW